ncbi:Sodium-dependent nutrient amino acid transporter 1 [Folsomia candida]|uniref:Transporter n=1 Tax=Folsomia candida TaxID=158441 RepID=A0A226E0N1_FOLCA|nr:Sodium-dependent nutrient amino acid transporter 1 [Folsomia candida]
MPRDKYSISEVENGNGNVNQAFEYDGPHQNNNTTTSTQLNVRGQLTSTVVQGPSDPREEWDSPLEFLLSCIAMSVGLGNIWRFPYIAFVNGGGAFLIPYLIVLFLIGKPMYFLEMAMGQFSSQGQVKVWKMSPFFKGVGYASAFGTACVCSYYCSLMAITIFYFFQSFQSELPWSVCNPEWEISHNLTCGPNHTVIGSNKSLPELYFKIDVLREIDSIDDGIGLPEWRLSLCLLASWAIILFSLIKGVKSAGKYFVLIILLIRGLTLPGATTGISYFFSPQWEKLLDPSVWAAAVTQCFFSLSTGFGPIIMFSSYNKFSHNVYRDAMIISIMDTLTSILAGVTIFSVLGNLAYELGKEIEDVASAGPGLAFVSYPEAISKFQFVPQLFAVLFFLMLFTLGVGSATSLTNAIITVIHDQFSSIEKKWITTVVCIVGFFSGLIYVTPGGQFMLELVDTFGAGFIIFIVALLEMIGFVWIYGLNNLVRDIEFMLNIKISWYWKFCWSIFIPVSLSVIFIQATIKSASSTLKYNGASFPPEAVVCGWMIAAVALLILPVAALHSVWTRKAGSLDEKFMESFRPTSEWGPKDPKIRESWLRTPPGKSAVVELKEMYHTIKKRTVK